LVLRVHIHGMFLTRSELLALLAGIGAATLMRSHGL
jgi:hypothetical protein